MATIYVDREGDDGPFHIVNYVRGAIAIRVTDVLYEPSVFSHSTVAHLTMHYDDGSSYEMHHHVGNYKSYGRLSISFLDLLVRGGSLITSREYDLRGNTLALKNGIYMFSDANEALRHFNDAKLYPHEGYYIGLECVISGKIQKYDVH